MATKLRAGETVADTRAGRFTWTYIQTIITVFFLGWTFVYADRTTMFPLLPTIGREFGLIPPEIGFIASAYFMVYSLMQIPSGVLGDRFGHNRVVAICYAISGIGMLGVGFFANSYATLLVFVALYGLGAGAYYSNAFGLAIGAVPPENRGDATGMINAGMAAGMILGLVTSGPILALTGNWRAPFLVLAVPTLLMALTYALVLRNSRAPRTEESNAPVQILLGFARDRDIIVITVASFCSLIGWWVVLTWAPGFFQTERGMDPTLSGVLTATIAVAALPASWWFGRFSDRIGRKRMSIALVATSGLVIALMAVVTSFPLLVLVMLLYGALGKLAWDPIMLAWYGDRATQIRPGALGSAIGLFSSVGMVSSIIAPTFTGWIKYWTGSVAGGFFLAAALAIIGAGLLLWAKETVAADRSTAGGACPLSPDG